MTTSHETQFLGAWLHPYFSSSIVPTDIEPDDEPLEPFPFGPDIENARGERKFWAEKIATAGGKIVPAEKARHMIAVIDKDPFPAQAQGVFECKDLILSDRIVPSPIAPSSRQIVFTICWLIDGESRDIDSIKSDVLAFSNALFQVFVEYDSNTVSRKQFLVIDILPRITNIFTPTRLILQEIESELSASLLQIEDVLKDRLTVRRATEVYWDTEILMDFRYG